MAGEKLEENRGLTPSQRNAELIIVRLSEYLGIRFDHASRINPELGPIKQDLLYHELSNVRHCLYSDKIYGPTRQIVADVLLGDDERRRRGLMSPSDQTSIQVELVSHCQDSKVETTRGQIKIHDLKTYYAAIHPPLTEFMDLFETWIWWDILDSAEIVRFEQKLGKIALVRQGKLTDDNRRRYSMLIHPPTDVNDKIQIATDEDIILYELAQLQVIRDAWEYRRSGERGFKFVLKREELPHQNKGELIHKIAAKVREYDAIESLEDINDDLRHAYATDLKMQPMRVTKELILQLLQDQSVALEREMLNQSEHEVRLGPPYNFKDRQLEQMDKWMNDLRAQLKAIGIVPKVVESEAEIAHKASAAAGVKAAAALGLNAAPAAGSLGAAKLTEASALPPAPAAPPKPAPANPAIPDIDISFEELMNQK